MPLILVDLFLKIAMTQDKSGLEKKINNADKKKRDSGLVKKPDTRQEWLK